MKKLSLFSMLTLLSITMLAQEFTPLPIGSSAPLAEVKMKAVNGQSFSIKDAMAKNGVLVMFSCNTCPVVVKYQSRTIEALKNAKANGFGIIVINSNEAYRDKDDSYAAMKTYATKQQYKDVPYVVDNKSAVANAFGATRTPECFLFNNMGKLIYHGAIDDNATATEATRNHLAEAIKEAANSKKVTVPESRSLGCTIKRIS